MKTVSPKRQKYTPRQPVSLDVALAMLGGISPDTFERNYQASLTDARPPEKRRKRCKRYFFVEEIESLQTGGIPAVLALRKALNRIEHRGGK